MKEIEEELKEIEFAQNVETPTIEDMEVVFKNAQRKSVADFSRPMSAKRRLYPECYTAFTLNDVPIRYLHEETLFYIFYTLHGSELQVKAYNELISRNYMYSTALDCFIIHSYSHIADGKRKNIIVFDPVEWQKIVKEVVFDQTFVANLVSKVEEIELPMDELVKEVTNK
ncbi:hypothetical protein PAEPH01_0703 [Pancytospora epiphaga]|nr:hypothetical protein PAEPH01_0703 [Pancytospora epiphaga]